MNLFDCSWLTYRIINSNSPATYRYITPYGIHKAGNAARSRISNRYIQPIKIGDIGGFSESFRKNGFISRKLRN